MLKSYKSGYILTKNWKEDLMNIWIFAIGLYNRLIEEINNASKEERKIGPKDTQALIVKFKEENPELKKVYSKVLQMVNYQLWSNIWSLSQLKKKGRKVGKLRYKKNGRYKSMNFNQSGFSIYAKSNRIFLSKIGSIKAKIHTRINGKVKGVWIKRYPSGKWYAIIHVEKDKDILPETGKEIGIDLA
ncbi:MAG: hypothetical protein RAK23_03800 [Thermoplasmata archaeon]|nr:hypothetical protein [Thermoplasmata archaeon]